MSARRVSATDGATGAGARSVITVTPGAFSAGDEFKVAGVDVTVSHTNADATTLAQNLGWAPAKLEAAMSGSSDIDLDDLTQLASAVGRLLGGT